MPPLRGWISANLNDQERRSSRRKCRQLEAGSRLFAVPKLGRICEYGTPVAIQVLEVFLSVALRSA